MDLLDVIYLFAHIFHPSVPVVPVVVIVVPVVVVVIVVGWCLMRLQQQNLINSYINS